jgi:peptide/nickel transport system permease protein
MLSYIAHRLAYMIVILVLISIVCFYIINLPPGSFIETFATQLEAAGSPASQAQLDYLTLRYGLDQPLHVQYWNWDRAARDARRLRLFVRMAAAGVEPAS